MDPRRVRIRELKVELHSLKAAARAGSSEMSSLSRNERENEIRHLIKSLKDDLKKDNVRGYSDMTNRMNAIRSSYKAGGLNLGQYEHVDDDQK